MVDNGICGRCALVAPAEVLVQCSGIEHYASTAVGLDLQKLWITLAKSSVMMALEWRLGRPDGVKLALERRLRTELTVRLALEWRLWAPSNVKLALDQRELALDASRILVGRALGLEKGSSKSSPQAVPCC